MKRVWIVAFVFALTLSFATLAHAQSYELYGETGYTTYALGELNELIDLINDVQGSLPGSHKEMKHLNGGLVFAGGVSMPMSDTVDIRIGLDYLALGKSTGIRTIGFLPAAAPLDFTPLGTVSDEKTTVTLTGSVLGYTGGGRYLVHDSGEFVLHAAGSVGYYQATKLFTITTSAGDPDFEMKSNGGGVGVNVGLSGDYALNSDIDLEVGIGYRHLKISEMKTKDGDVVSNVDLEPLEMDLSGLNFRIGARYRF